MKIVPRKARRLNELALFAGAGGGVLASRLLGWRTVCAVEIDPYCREVLLRRQEEGHLEPFPIWDNVRSFDAKLWRGIVDVVSGGFPCQPFSVAGKRAGENDERNLWPETLRIIREVEPRFAFLENVPGLLCPIQDKKAGETQASYFGTILGDLAESGYDARWRVLSASAYGAPHRRDRLWIVAIYSDSEQQETQQGIRTGASSDTARSRRTISDSYRDQLRVSSGWRGGTRRKDTTESRDDGAEGAMANSDRRRQQVGQELNGQSEVDSAFRDSRWQYAYGCRNDMADANSARLSQRQANTRRISQAHGVEEGNTFTGGGWWSTEPSVGRVAHGVAFRVDRLKALGNGQVPAVARAAWELLTQ